MLIYIVEDDKSISDIESYALRSGGYDVRALCSAQEFLEELKKETPDLIILDVMLPDYDGLTLVRKIREQERLRYTPIMLVTAICGELEKVKGLDAGADDYITKPFGLMEFMSRVKALFRRALISNIQQDDVMKVGDLQINDSKREVVCCGQNLKLTYKEFELLKYLVVNKGLVLSRDKIMENVWGFDFQGESRTVDMHIKTLRHKLGVNGKIIITIRNIGYKLQ